MKVEETKKKIVRKKWRTNPKIKLKTSLFVLKGKHRSAEKYEKTVLQQKA